MKIVFLGSGDFAFPLARRISEIHDLIAVVVAKPKPKGRGLKIELPEIVEWAQSQSINILAPENPNAPDFIKKIIALKPELFILASYGYILKKDFLLSSALGGINIHPSLLPRYRGAAPIQRCLMNGDDRTGITIFFMDEKIDHGEIIFQEGVVIRENDNYGSLSTRLAEKAASVIESVLESVINNTCFRKKQDENSKSLAPKIRKEEIVIDWQKPAYVIHNLIRALAPKPGARTVFRNRDLIILRTEIYDKDTGPGEILRIDREMAVGSGKGMLIIKQLKPSNRTVMTGQAFINGIRLKQGEMMV